MRDGLNAALDKVQEIVAENQSGLSTGGYAHQGPPKLESGYYSSGRMVGFGSDGSSSSYAHATSYRERDVRAAEYSGYVRSSAESGWSREGSHSQEGPYAHENDERRYHGSSDDRSYQGASAERRTGGYAVPGAYSRDAGDERRQSNGGRGYPAATHEPHRSAVVPRIESGYYSSGKMQGFGSEDVNASRYGASGGYPNNASDRYARGGYASRAAYDRDERTERMAALVEMSSRGVAAAVSTVSAISESLPARGESTYTYAEGTSGELLRRGEMGGGYQSSESAMHAYGDDDHHGADAWTSHITWDADGTQRVVREGDTPPKPASARPTVPRPAPPALMDNRPSRPSVELPRRPQPMSGHPRVRGGSPPQPTQAEANLLGFDEPPPAPPPDLFDAFPAVASDPFAPAAASSAAQFDGAAAHDPFSSSAPPTDNFAPTPGAFADVSDPFAPAPVSAPTHQPDPFAATFQEDPFAPAAVSAPPQPPPPVDEMTLLAGLDLGASPAIMTSPPGAGLVAHPAAPAAAPASAAASKDAAATSKDPWALSLMNKVIDLEDITAPKGGAPEAPKPSGPMGLMKPSGARDSTGSAGGFPAGAMPGLSPNVSSMKSPSGFGGAMGGGMGVGGMGVGMGGAPPRGGPPMPMCGGGMCGGMGGGMGSSPMGVGAPPMVGAGMAGSRPGSMGMPGGLPMGGTGCGGGVASSGPADGPKFCANCGAKRTGGNFCSNCGAKFS